jgi:hypothetical protein
MTKSNVHLVDPPIVDALRVDRERDAFVVTFIPSDDLPDEPKLVVTIPAGSVEGRQIQVWLRKFRELLASSADVERIVHGGGGDFTLVFADSTSRQLSDPDLDGAMTQQIYDGLQYVSQAAENAYRIVQINRSRTA